MGRARTAFISAAGAAVLASCASSGPAPAPPAPPPAVPEQVRQVPPAVAEPPPVDPRLRRPPIMLAAGLEDVIGKSADALVRVLGTPRLDSRDGDMRKLQFSGEACVLDVYLYPLREGGEPEATWIEARRRSDGLDVDRTACIDALRR